MASNIVHILIKSYKVSLYGNFEGRGSDFEKPVNKTFYLLVNI